MEKARKEKLYKEIDRKTQAVSHPTTVHETINFWISGVPIHLAEEWRKDCRSNYNDIYWAKIWSDHLKARSFDILTGGVSVNEEEKEDFGMMEEEDGRK